jgi:hypothetical protein
MKVVAHIPKPVPATYSIEGLTEQEARTLLALVGGIGDTEGSYLVERARLLESQDALGDGCYGSPLRNLCDSMWVHLSRSLKG